MPTTAMETVAVLFGAIVAAQISSATLSPPFIVKEGTCANMPDVEWTKSINAWLREIPKVITYSPFDIGDMILGVNISAPKLTGLGTMWQYQPYRSFCVDNITIVEADVYAEDPLVLSVEWTSCCGSFGSFGTKILSDKLRLLFRSLPSNEDPARIELLKIQPVTVEDPELFVLGAKENIKSVVNVASVLLTPYTEQIWKTFLSMDIEFLIKNHDKM